MRILVTGAAGFVGRHLGRRLREQECEVVEVDRDVDVSSPDQVSRCVAEARPDAMITSSPAGAA